MPFQVAMAVAQGRMSLNEALERMAQKEQVERLMEKHDLSRALATQIIMGHASLEAVLAKRRLHEHRTANLKRSCLDEAAADERSLTLVLHGSRRLSGRILSTTPYTFIVQDDDSGDEEEIHKLQAQYAYDPGDWKRVRKAVKTDKNVSARVQEPIPRPQDRYTCSDKRMFRYLDQQTTINVVLLEGDLFRGEVTWFGRYEFGLQLKGAEIVVFRHALHEVSIAT